MAKALEEQCPWLIHPCMSPLLEPRFRNHDAQARLIFWSAVNSGDPLRRFGTLHLEQDCHLFGTGGGFFVPAGEHEIALLADQMQESIYNPLPDPWGQVLPDHEAIGDLAHTSWWANAPQSDAGLEKFRSSIMRLLKAQKALQKLLPDVWNWFANMTCVVVPLRESEVDQFRSGTVTGIPGLVIVEITDSHLLTLEALIHETAHLYFHFAELDAPFVRPEHDKLYSSPLRRDPRPLRGIFLAYHALIYMCGFYREWFEATDDDRCREALEGLRPLCQDAGHILIEAKDGLTRTGQDFLGKCNILANIACKPDAGGGDV